jgi:hypothetical protein
MSMEIRLMQEARQTRVVIAGHPSLGQLCSLMQVLGIDSQSWAADSALFDLASVDTPFSEADKAQLQEEAARNLPRMHALAFVWHQEP